MPEPRSSPSPAVEGDWFPVSRGEHRAQIAGLLRRLGRAPRRILDVGCGGGRIAIPLAEAGHSIVALDRDASALRACVREAGRAGVIDRIRTRRADVQRRPGAAVGAGLFDAVVCLGHAFMELHDPLRALALLSALRGAMSPSRRAVFLAIDDLCEPLWEEVASGRWQRGVSGDGAWQLVWARGDNEFALRRGRDVRPRDRTIRVSDRRLRLWSMGELRLLAKASGWGPPTRSAPDHLIVFGSRP